MIPKQIHYCWFGPKKMPRIVRECIQTWHTHMPDYKFILWNEESCTNLPSDIENPLNHPFVRSAYDAKKYAFVADYVRFWALYHFGGIYLDTDVYVVKPFDDLLYNKCFFAWEDSSQTKIGACVIGAENGLDICFRILQSYDKLLFRKDDIPSLVIPNVISSIILSDKSIRICPYDSFYPYSYEQNQQGHRDFLSTITVNTYAIHLWNLSWSSWYQKLWSRIMYTYNHWRLK